MNETDMLPIPAGALLILTAGEYSGYGVEGLFRAKALLEPTVLLKEYLSTSTAEGFEATLQNFEDHRFIGWLVKRGLIEHIDCYEWHTSNGYGLDRASGMRLLPPGST